MTMGVFDFKAIRSKLECQDQKAEFEAKNPKPVEAAPVVWTPEWGYGAAVPLDPDVVYVLAPSAVNAAGVPFDLHEKADALAQQLLDNYAFCSAPPLDWLKAKS